MTNHCLQPSSQELANPSDAGNGAPRRGKLPARGPAGRGKGGFGGKASAIAVVSEPKLVRGRDGRAVQIRSGFVAVQGRDGRVVAIPSGSGSLEGSDGRVVAIPPGHLGIENAKGRVVPKPRW